MAVEKIDTILYRLFSDRFRIVHHILFWIIYFLDFFMSVIKAGLDPRIPLSEVLVSPTYLYFAIDALLIYVNLYIFIRLFLLKNRIWLYFILTSVALVIDITLCTLIGLWDCNCFNERLTTLTFFNYFVSSAQNTIFFLGTATGLKLFKIWIKNQKKIKILETEKLKTELNYLKNQMNPHFLFNTLNNIYVQTKIDHLTASQTILKLSDLLRYQLYDCSKEKVNLASEIDYLRNYLALEKIRKSKIRLDFSIEGKVNNLMIHPFLFIPFLENAIKHGTTGKDAFISIKIIICDRQLTFTVENSVHETIRCISDGGVGLANVKRRLELLYPDKHSLKAEELKNSYKVELILDLL
ncbi:MAG: histidine kinase [Bacteroidetes bacterium]|nr:histidine kinase [Bacteroidota bacterium]